MGPAKVTVDTMASHADVGGYGTAFVDKNNLAAFREAFAARPKL